MLKENWRLIARIERVADNIIIVASFLIAYYSRNSLLFWNDALGLALPFEKVLLPVGDYLVVLLTALIGYALSLNLTGAYGSMRMSSSWFVFKRSMLCSVLVFFAIASTLFILKVDRSRSFIGLFCFLSGLLITAERLLVLRWLRYWRKQGRNYRNIIICGVGEQGIQLATEILKRPELGIRLVGFGILACEDGKSIKDDEKAIREKLSVLPQPVKRLFFGGSNIESALKDFAIDEVMFTDVVDVMPAVEELVMIGSEQGIRTTLVADIFSMRMLKSEVSYFGGMPLIHYHTPPGDRWELAVKRTIDLIVSALSLIILSPLFILVAIAIKIDSKGPVLFRQKRVGLNGRLFSLYKFRSMRLGADKELRELAASNEMKGPAFKMTDDPRVTTVGRLLRRFSLDELPQLWNVLRGDMSLVGPRPPVPGEVRQYERKFRRRLSMRPGLTCTWQVSGRSEINDFEKWVELDLEYIDNWSLVSDFKLLLRTVPAVFFGHGAR